MAAAAARFTLLSRPRDERRRPCAYETLTARLYRVSFVYRGWPAWVVEWYLKCWFKDMYDGFVCFFDCKVKNEEQVV